MNYKLDSVEIEKIERLIRLTSSIDEIYTKLYSLELNGKKNTEQYVNLLEYLKSIKNAEDNMYSDENLTLEKCTVWANYILSNKAHKNFFDGLEGIIIRDHKNRVINRILCVLKKKVIYDYNNMTKLIPNEALNLVKNLGIPHGAQLTNYAIRSNIEINKAIEKDTFNGFLLFLQEFIDNDKYNKIKSDLIHSKYDTSFINIDIENDLINNNFEIPSTLYENSRFIADLFQLPLNILTLVKDSSGSRNAMIQISELIRFSDSEYNNEEKLITSILRQCLLRSSLLLISDDMVYEINSKFHELIDDKEYLIKHQNDRISEQIIIDCFKGIKKDKAKQNVISFGYRKK